MTNFFDISVKTIDGTVTTLTLYKGKVMLIVNVASKCGFTSQYEGLEELYRTFKDRGLVILGFPCNQFGGQEPGSEEQIMDFCRINYGVTFPMFAKIEVNGANTHLLYMHLKKEQPGILGSEVIKWNFTKFLVDREGHVMQRFSSSSKPASLVKEIELLL